MKKSAWNKCFDQLGAPLGDAELKAVGKLARRIDEDGSAEVGASGHAFDSLLEPDLEEMNAAGDDDLDLESTIGAAIRTFRQLSRDADDSSKNESLVPSSYVPIAMGNGEVVLLVGIDGERRGKLFVMTMDGQDQVLENHGDVEEIGVLADLT